jgi:hypothetical protein
MNHALNGTYGTSYSSYRTRELSFRRCFVKGKSGDLQRGLRVAEVADLMALKIEVVVLGFVPK